MQLRKIDHCMPFEFRSVLALPGITMTTARESLPAKPDDRSLPLRQLAFCRRSTFAAVVVLTVMLVPGPATAAVTPSLFTSSCLLDSRLSKDVSGPGLCTLSLGSSQVSVETTTAGVIVAKMSGSFNGFNIGRGAIDYGFVVNGPVPGVPVPVLVATNLLTSRDPLLASFHATAKLEVMREDEANYVSKVCECGRT